MSIYGKTALEWMPQKIIDNNKFKLIMVQVKLLGVVGKQAISCTSVYLAWWRDTTSVKGQLNEMGSSKYYITSYRGRVSLIKHPHCLNIHL